MIEISRVVHRIFVTLDVMVYLIRNNRKASLTGKQTNTDQTGLRDCRPPACFGPVRLFSLFSLFPCVLYSSFLFLSSSPSPFSLFSLFIVLFRNFTTPITDPHLPFLCFVLCDHLYFFPYSIPLTSLSFLPLIYFSFFLPPSSSPPCCSVT